MTNSLPFSGAESRNAGHRRTLRLWLAFRLNMSAMCSIAAASLGRQYLTRLNCKGS